MKKILLFLSLLMLSSLSVNAQEKANDKNVRICAHRGFWNTAGCRAQNSVQSLQLAQDNDFWGSEFDVHLTADSIVVVNHDPVFAGKVIQQSKYERLLGGTLPNGESIPTLDAYLEQGRQKETMLVLELKPQKDRAHANVMADLCIAQLRDKELLDPQRVMFISFDYEACKHVAQALPEFTVQYLEGDKDPDTVYSDGINGIDYHYSCFHKHPEWVARAHELGMSVNVWTVDNPKEMQNQIDLGVDCITTNEPLELRKLLGL